MARKRKIVELIGDNNGETYGVAKFWIRSWYCQSLSDGKIVDTAHTRSRRDAEGWLREVAGATRIIRCPAVGQEAPPCTP